MKDATSIAIVFVVCIVFLALYFFVAQRQMNIANTVLSARLDDLKQEELDINKMGIMITQFQDRLPELKRRINYYKLAIPTNIEDELFFAHLASELRRNGVELLEVQQSAVAGCRAGVEYRGLHLDASAAGPPRLRSQTT